MSVAEQPSNADRLGRCAAEWSGAERVRVGEWDVRYREAGDGPSIVLVHGLGVSADYWWRNGPPLAAAGFRVLAPDLPGFGRTKGPEAGLSVTQQATALREWTEALALPAATFVGHSLSCQTILQLAVEWPDRVTGLVLAAPTGEPARHRLLHQAVGLLLDIPRESPRLAVEVATAYLLAGPRRIWRTWNLGGKHDPLPLLPRVTAPGIVLLGTRDPVVPHDFARSLAHGLGQPDITWIQDAAHALIFTHADAFNAAVLDFIGTRG
ncbi:MAG: alpha/beta hydrolase [Gemmatimonadetes bacterium]|nr:alpha/beta hydrolase [Gemmatimonadota bacterium]